MHCLRMLGSPKNVRGLDIIVYFKFRYTNPRMCPRSIALSGHLPFEPHRHRTSKKTSQSVLK